MKNLTSWILVFIGTVSISISIALLFPSAVGANCSISVTCPVGPNKTCAGTYCQASGTCVTCTINGRVTMESGCCIEE